MMQQKMLLTFRAVLCGLVLLSLGATANAQFKAAVQGTVTDPTGAIVPGASVTLTDKGTGRTQEVKTSDDGFYRIAGLAPSVYTLTVEQTGFKKNVLENVIVRAEETQGLDVTLSTGEVAETVTVTSEGAQTLETENPNINKAISEQEVKRLPQFGRDPYELLRLTPGIFGDAARGGAGSAVGLPNSTGPGGSNSSVFQVENQPQISANGQRVSANNFQIDGVSVNSLTFGGAAVVTPNQESVKEVRVLSNTYSAEDGRNSGAQIKVVSQNGTNEFHGSLFLKYNSPKLNAFNKYGTGFGAGGPERVNQLFRQFGGSVGGPIYLPNLSGGLHSGKDRAFFFFSYEGLRNNSSSSSTRFVETPEYRALVQRVRPNSLTARILGTDGIAPRIAGLVTPTCASFGNDPSRCRVVAGGLDIGSPAGAQSQYLGNALGGGFDGIPDIQQAVINSPTRLSANQFNPRFDFNLTSKDTLTLSAFVTRSNSLASDEASGSRPLDDLRNSPTNTAITLIYNRVLSSSALNEARFSFTRFAFDQVQASSDTNFGIPRIEIESLPFDRIRFGAPQGETSPGIFAENTFEFRDVFSKLVGNHGLKFGAEIRREQDNNNLNGGSRPLYTFGGLFNFANDAPLFYQINADPRTGGAADAQRHFRTGTYAFFGQDDWKVRPNLTLNLGLRYEYFTPLREKDGILSNLVFGSNGLSNARVVTTDRLFKPDRNNFAPRLGFAYSPKYFGEQDKLVLRGGFGISYNRLPDVLFSNTRGNPPFFARYAICCGTDGSPFAGGQILYALGANNSPFSYPVNPALAVGINPATGTPLGRQVEVYGAESEVPNAYIYSYSFGGQYILPNRFFAELGYQGSSSHKLVRLVNERFIYSTPSDFFASAVFFPQPDVNANYNALLARISRSFSRGVQFDANYRFSKSIDQLSNEGPGAETNQTFPQDNRSERGPSDFDVRHNFTASGLYELPFFRERKDAVGKLLSGFQINGILTYHTGFPYTPKTGTCVSTPGGQTLCPSRPSGYFGGNLTDTGNDAFIRPGGNFPGGGQRYFNTNNPNGLLPPGIGRNSFRGPRYFNVDMSVAKRTGLPGFLGEGAFFEFKVNAFNVFNKLNLAPFRFFDRGLIIEDPNFGRAERGLAGRVVELQGRFSF